MADEQLEQLRSSIDDIDDALITMLADRFRITQAVGEHKARTGLAPADPEREDRQIARLRAIAAEAGLSPDFSERFMRMVFAEVVSRHQQTATEI